MDIWELYRLRSRVNWHFVNMPEAHDLFSRIELPFLASS